MKSGICLHSLIALPESILCKPDVSEGHNKPAQYLADSVPGDLTSANMAVLVNGQVIKDT